MSAEAIIEIMTAFFEGIIMILQVVFFIYLRIDIATMKSKSEKNQKTEKT